MHGGCVVVWRYEPKIKIKISVRSVPNLNVCVFSPFNFCDVSNLSVVHIDTSLPLRHNRTHLSPPWPSGSFPC